MSKGAENHLAKEISLSKHGTNDKKCTLGNNVKN